MENKENKNEESASERPPEVLEKHRTETIDSIVKKDVAEKTEDVAVRLEGKELEDAQKRVARVFGDNASLGIADPEVLHAVEERGVVDSSAIAESREKDVEGKKMDLQKDDSKKSESVFESNEKQVQEAGDTTVMEKPSDTSIEKKKSPIEDLKDLLQGRKINGELLQDKNTSPEKRSELIDERRQLSQEILKKSCEINGEDFTIKQIEIEREKINILHDMVDQKGPSYMEQREQKQREIFEGELIHNSALSDEQRKELEETGGISVGNWGRDIHLDKEAVISLLSAGLNPNDVKAGFLGLSSKIKVNNHTFKDLEEFNKFLSDNEQVIQGAVANRVAERDREIINTSEIPDIALDKVILKTLEPIQEQQRAEMLEKISKERAQAKEAAEGISLEDRVKKLSTLRNQFENARKADFVLRNEGQKIKAKGGEYLTAKDNPEELKKIRTDMSNEVVDIANEITGRDLRQEAMDEVGYDLNNPQEKQGEFFEKVTLKVKEVFAEQLERVKKEAEAKGGKIKYRKFKALPAFFKKEPLAEGAAMLPNLTPEVEALNQEDNFDEIINEVMQEAQKEVIIRPEPWRPSNEKEIAPLEPTGIPIDRSGTPNIKIVSRGNIEEKDR